MKTKKTDRTLLLELQLNNLTYTDNDGNRVVESGYFYRTLREDELDNLKEGDKVFEVVKRFKIKKETKLEEIK